jgi:hypothetical protein
MARLLKVITPWICAVAWCAATEIRGDETVPVTGWYAGQPTSNRAFGQLSASIR